MCYKGAKNLYTLGENMKYYLKKFFLIIVYLISSGVIASSVLIIEGMAWLKLILLALNLALFVFIYGAIAFKDGEKALRVRISNDKIRELIVQTGDDYKLDLEGEFTIRKGFITGATACIPLIFLLLLNLFFSVSNPNNIALQALELFYMVFFGFFNLDFLEVHKVALYASPYWTLIAIPVLIIVHGIFFYLGAKHLEAQQERFKQSHRRFHGE